jgi:hypothetical protein
VALPHLRKQPATLDAGELPVIASQDHFRLGLARDIQQLACRTARNSEIPRQSQNPLHVM